MNKRRSHPKLLQFPQELVEAVNQLIVKGYTYQEVTDFISQRGHEISVGSVKRYGKNFLARLERLKVVKEQARTIVQENADAPATEMAEAANQLATQLIMEHLMEVSDLEGEKVTEILKALSRLEQSGVAREKLKMEFKKKVKTALEAFKKEVYAELEGQEPELCERLIQVANRVAERLETDE